jgi:hypothetical protein
MKHKWILGLMIVVMLLIGACGASATPAAPPPIFRSEQPAGGNTTSDAMTTETKALPAPAQPERAPQAANGALPTGNQPSTGTAAVTDRMIIRNANLSLTVKDAEATLESVKSIAAQMGGFVSNSQTTRLNKDQVRVSVTIRVPADKFDDVLKQLKQGVIRVNTERITGQDVTEEYADIGARMKNLEAVEKELLLLLTTVREKSNRAEEILAVQRELNNTRMQIDQLKGRMQFLDRSVTLATITLDLIPDTLEAPVASDTWDPAGIARDAVRALVNALQGLVSIAIYTAICVLPILLIFALPAGFVWRWWRRRRRAKVSA